jgi:hypothetical protein
VDGIIHWTPVTDTKTPPAKRRGFSFGRSCDTIGRTFERGFFVAMLYRYATVKKTRAAKKPIGGEECIQF